MKNLKACGGQKRISDSRRVSSFSGEICLRSGLGDVWCIVLGVIPGVASELVVTTPESVGSEVINETGEAEMVCESDKGLSERDAEEPVSDAA